MTIDPKVMIPVLRKTIPKTVAEEIAGVQPMTNVYIPLNRQKQPETWQSYLRRLGSGLNGVAANKYITEEDILDNAQKWMQIKYPGNYRVEQYFNIEKTKWDLRLRFDDPKEETMWLLRWS